MQSVDFTTLVALCRELQAQWLPARIEQVYQRDRHTLSLALRTLERRGWLTLCWHPQAARLCLEDAPPRSPDTFTFSDQLRHQLGGFALTNLVLTAPWERVVDLQIAQRPGEDPRWHLYLEIMGKYSNAILTDGDNQIITVAHQVNAQQSRVRTVQTGQPYQLPPPLLATAPSLEEPFNRWQERLSLIPGNLRKQWVKTYRGLSPVVVGTLLEQAGLTEESETQTLTAEDWQNLFRAWQGWLQTLDAGSFQPGFTKTGYTVLGQDLQSVTTDVQTLIFRYYRDRLTQTHFSQLRHQLLQNVQNRWQKLQQKAQTFRDRLAQAEQAEDAKNQADLLMAHLHQWQVGMKTLCLPDFVTGQPIIIPLSPDKNAIQNAQSLYKKHQKLKRATAAVLPLLTAVETEMAYLEQVETSLQSLTNPTCPDEYQTLTEIREELSDQGYWENPYPKPRTKSPDYHLERQTSPSGYEIWIGRNNRQNDYLTFRVAGDYDLWFHSQEIAGSHILLRLTPGAIAEEKDLQCAADWAAYYSRGHQSEQVPVIYTQPKFVYKPKGAKPGMVVYKQETVVWGKPANILLYLEN